MEPKNVCMFFFKRSVHLLFLKDPHFHVNPIKYLEFFGGYVTTCYGMKDQHLQQKFPDLLIHLGVSKNRGTPNWMVLMENPIKMDDLGGKPTIFGNTHLPSKKTAFSKDFASVGAESFKLGILCIFTWRPLFGFLLLCSRSDVFRVILIIT